jgi:CubicO group peptidase (beta-lactamase class C family)
MKILPGTRQSRPDLARLQTLIDSAIVNHAFPAATLIVTRRGETVFSLAAGSHTYEPGSTPVTLDSIFDIASITKVLATTAMAMLLYERGHLDLERPVSAVLPEFSAGPLVTVRMLLAHCSGLPAYVRLFESSESREKLLQQVFSLPLEAKPGTRAQYSDIGFILLGVILERIACEPLDLFCAREIFAPLGMHNTFFTPGPEWRGRIVPTIDDKTFRQRIVCGEVHDENAFVMGGVAGHAGVFSVASDIARFADCMQRGGDPIFTAATVATFTQRQSMPSNTTRALGWDTPSTPSQSGKYLSCRSYGHLGYTGTSLWIDPDRAVSITLLTNRVWPDCRSQLIQQVRPALHDAIIEGLDQ